MESTYANSNEENLVLEIEEMSIEGGISSCQDFLLVQDGKIISFRYLEALFHLP